MICEIRFPEGTLKKEKFTHNLQIFWTQTSSSETVASSFMPMSSTGEVNFGGSGIELFGDDGTKRTENFITLGNNTTV